MAQYMAYNGMVEVNGPTIMSVLKGMPGNEQKAMKILEKEGIAGTGSSLGGTNARRIEFRPTTGAARQMNISGQIPDETATPIAAPSRPDITLF